ncbi:6-phosphofructo-2-kinase/fructose-2,6-bisphosphatase-like protein [Gossypium australe]|uniref:6-phosphofructo-2-kinase/fructose-2, 6-bisphosphatase-like protein n=1 Tax=Gossypium australe TaxID=47621 RepID=A0A5B6WS98_9ROSI|nr:6-phosphofructo-2-kinase/fructose-2,6-bisphosphatase-like protein [Gossypium australe]
MTKPNSYSTVTMVDKHLFRALAQYWNPAYNCFTFGKVDLVPTVEEYTTLLRCPRIQADKAYSRAINVSTFLKRLMSITRMSEQWVAAQIKQKGDNMKKRVDVFTLSIYGLVIFPKALGHIDEAVSDLFDQLDKRVTLVPKILAKTFRSLSACQFIGCAQLLLAWFHSHFWKVKKVSYRVFSKKYSLLKEFVATPRQNDSSEEK